jgi:glycosyltransferase involved in cell wall biosynthesis
MVHEPFLAFREGTWRQDAAALVHRFMTILLLHGARRVWVSIPRWEKAWKPYRLGRAIPFSWLPLPSNVPVVKDQAAVSSLRARYAPGGEQIVGHFGTFGHSIASMLQGIVPHLLQTCEGTTMVFIGPNGAELRDRIMLKYPQYQDRIYATGSMPATDPRLSAHLMACDLMIQPYPDGASSRRTSLLAPLAHGVPIITTSGPSTEPFWRDSEAVVIVPAQEMDAFVSQALRLLADGPARRRFALAARALYQKYFAIETIAEVLRSSYRPSTAQREVPGATV